MKKPEHKILSMDVSKNLQDVHFEQILQLGEYKVRLQICSNAYQFQSHARAQVWQKDKLAWSQLVHIQPEAMKTPATLYAHSNVHLGVFAKDADELVRKATLVLF